MMSKWEYNFCRLTLKCVKLLKKIVYAHYETCALSYRHARSLMNEHAHFLRSVRSSRYVPLHSSSHKLSNDMLECILLFIIAGNFIKSISAQELSARARKVRHRASIEFSIGKVNTCTQCAAVRNIRLGCGFLLQLPNSLSYIV